MYFHEIFIKLSIYLTLSYVFVTYWLAMRIFPISKTEIQNEVCNKATASKACRYESDAKVKTHISS